MHGRSNPAQSSNKGIPSRGSRNIAGTGNPASNSWRRSFTTLAALRSICSMVTGTTGKSGYPPPAMVVMDNSFHEYEPHNLIENK